MREERVTTGTGFQKHLYRIPGLSKDMAQLLETDFFSKIDDKAAKTYELLLEGRLACLTEDQKIAWAAFIMVLMFRTPGC